MTLPCGEQPLPEGTLVAVQPQLEPEESAGIAVRLPDGRREIVGVDQGLRPGLPDHLPAADPARICRPGSVIVTDARGNVRDHAHDCGTSMTNAAVTTAPLR